MRRWRSSNRLVKPPLSLAASGAARAASSWGSKAMLPVAVVISGRGSNMEAIARASFGGASRYRVVRVIADRDGAGGLARAAALGIPTSVVPVRQFDDRASFDAALAAELDGT